ncbi:MAG: lysophospholipid acyltransferase family protein [Kiloniellales bacterium]
MPQTLIKGAGSVRQRRPDRDRTSNADTAVPVKPLVANDLIILAALPVSFAVAWTLPASLLPSLARLFSPLAARALATRNRLVIERIERLVRDRPLACPPTMVVRELISGQIEEYLQVLREHRPLGWHPGMRLEGRGHVDAALERGCGAILWLGHFSFSALVTKQALHRDGIETSHLTHPSHGFSRSRFGMRYLNRVRMQVEDRYLREQVMISLHGSTRAMRELHRRLRGNGVVSLTVRERALRPSSVRFLDGTIKVATGAADLAYATGATLLPVFTVREPDGHYRVVIEPPLEVRRDLPRREASDLVLRDYAARLTPYVLAYPGQWRGWMHA